MSNDELFNQIMDKAFDEGYDAGLIIQPTPMVMTEHENPMDDSSSVIRKYNPVNDGVCGFASVHVKPGNCKFANFLKHQGYAKTDIYLGGVRIDIFDFNQSYERKRAMAEAMVEVLHRHIGELGNVKDIYSTSQLD